MITTIIDDYVMIPEKDCYMLARRVERTRKSDGSRYYKTITLGYYSSIGSVLKACLREYERTSLMNREGEAKIDECLTIVAQLEARFRLALKERGLE